MLAADGDIQRVELGPQLGQHAGEMEQDDAPDREGNDALRPRQPRRGAEQLVHRVDDEADQRQSDHQRDGDREEKRRIPAPKNGSGNEHQRERRERQQHPVDAAEAEAHHLRLRRGLEAQPAIQHPADREADGDDGELPPAGRRGKRGLDVGEIDRHEHAESLPELAFARRRSARVGDARYAARVSTSA